MIHVVENTGAAGFDILSPPNADGPNERRRYAWYLAMLARTAAKSEEMEPTLQTQVALGVCESRIGGALAQPFLELLWLRPYLHATTSEMLELKQRSVGALGEQAVLHARTSFSRRNRADYWTHEGIEATVSR